MLVDNAWGCIMADEMGLGMLQQEGRADQQERLCSALHCFGLC